MAAALSALVVAVSVAVAAPSVAGPRWTEPVIVMRPTGADPTSTLTVRPNGDKIAAWSVFETCPPLTPTGGVCHREAMYVSVKPHGTTLWPTQALVSGDHHPAGEPAVASTPSGRVVLVYTYSRPREQGDQLRYALMEPGSTRFGKPHVIAEPAGMTTGAEPFHPELVATPTGRIVAVWDEDGTLLSGAHAARLATATLEPGKTRFARSTVLPVNGLFGALVATPDGTVVSAATNTKGVLVTRLAPGTARWSAPEALRSGSPGGLSLAVGDDGTLALGWTTIRSVFAAVERPGQLHFSQKKSLPPPGVAGPQPSAPEIAVSTSGAVTLTYLNLIGMRPAPVVDSYRPARRGAGPRPGYTLRNYVASYDPASGRWSGARHFDAGLGAWDVRLAPTKYGSVVALWASSAKSSFVTLVESSEVPGGSTRFSAPRTIARRSLPPTTLAFASGAGQLVAWWLDVRTMMASVRRAE